jgi:hypothetical protein
MVPARTARLALSYDPYTALLTVDGQVASIEEALSMLAQATRSFEDQRRMLVLQQVQAAAAERALTAQVRADIQRRN